MNPSGYTGQCQVCSRTDSKFLTTWNSDIVCHRCMVWSIHAESNRGKETILETENRRLWRAGFALRNAPHLTLLKRA